MAKRPPAHYKPPPLDFDFRPFNVRTLRRILAEAGAPATPDKVTLIAARKRLNQAAQWRRMQEGLHAAPTEDDVRKTLERFRKVASALQAEFPVVYEVSLFEGHAGPGENPRVTDGVARLLTATHGPTDAGACRAGARRARPRPRS